MEQTNQPAPDWQHEATRALTVLQCAAWIKLRAGFLENTGGAPGVIAELHQVAADLPDHLDAGWLRPLVRGLIVRGAVPCPDCGSEAAEVHRIECPRWMVVLTGTGLPPAPARIEPEQPAMPVDLPCGCLVTELRVGVRMTADQLGAEAYCMVCDQVLTGVDVVAVQR